MRLSLLPGLVSVVLLWGCNHSRRTVREAPGFPALFAHTSPHDSKLATLQRAEPETCSNWPDSSWCAPLLRGWSFTPGALELCAAETDRNDARDCAVTVAERAFSPLALDTCGGLSEPKHRLDCLDAVADRRLDAHQFRHCADLPSKDTAKCLDGLHDYRFHPDELQQVIRETLDAAEDPSPTALIRDLETTFAQRFDLDTSKWPEHYVFNFAGGATTHIKTMYCALDEYLLIVGAPIDVNGYSGRYPAEVHDFVFTGLMHDFEEHDHTAHDYEAGSWAFLQHGTHRVYATETPTYMVEYARGNIPGMLGFGIRHPRHAITQDRKNMRQQIKMCARRALDANKERRAERRERRQDRRAVERDIRRALRNSG